MALPLSPPIEPWLARTAKELPEGEQWRYEPKWDGFRTIVFRDGDDVFLQSRNGKRMDRYFPEILPAIRGLASKRCVVDGELVVVVDGVQEFDLLSQRIHPAASRAEKLARETPAAFVAFDLLAEGRRKLLERPYEARRQALEQVVAGEVQLTPVTDDRDAAGSAWLTGESEGVIAKDFAAPYLPGERKGMAKIKRVRTLEAVVMAYRSTEKNELASFKIGLYDGKDRLIPVGHTSAFTAKARDEHLARIKPLRTGRSTPGEPSRWRPRDEPEWIELRPELVCEVSFDHITGHRIRHGAHFIRWRADKPPADCRLDQLRA